MLLYKSLLVLALATCTTVFAAPISDPQIVPKVVVDQGITVPGLLEGHDLPLNVHSLQKRAGFRGFKPGDFFRRVGQRVRGQRVRGQREPAAQEPDRPATAPGGTQTPPNHPGTSQLDHQIPESPPPSYHSSQRQSVNDNGQRLSPGHDTRSQRSQSMGEQPRENSPTIQDTHGIQSRPRTGSQNSITSSTGQEANRVADGMHSRQQVPNVLVDDPTLRVEAGKGASSGPVHRTSSQDSLRPPVDDGVPPPAYALREGSVRSRTSSLAEQPQANVPASGGRPPSEYSVHSLSQIPVSDGFRPQTPPNGQTSPASGQAMNRPANGQPPGYTPPNGNNNPGGDEKDQGGPSA